MASFRRCPLFTSLHLVRRQPSFAGEMVAQMHNCFARDRIAAETTIRPVATCNAAGVAVVAVPKQPVRAATKTNAPVRKKEV